MSEASIKNPQNIRTCMLPATRSLRTLFWPSQPVVNSLILVNHESKRLSCAPNITSRVAFCT